MSHKRKAYASDLTRLKGNRQWAWLEPQLEDRLAQNRLGRPMELDLREVINTILYVVRNGVAWANVPHDLLKPHSVYYHFRKLMSLPFIPCCAAFLPDFDFSNTL